ncbi:LamG domain-containing protein [Streptomyces tubercidicus]|uniref:LamG domain-containing protein n=1 Tax=Streptomyces tubercidicus TaxID=47759 RepID=UPI0036CBFEEB
MGSTSVLSIQNFALPPYTQSGQCCDLSVDGTVLDVRQLQWSAYELLRKATAANDLEITTATRLAFEDNQIFFEVTASNPTASDVATTLSVNLNPQIGKVTSGWDWAYPHPGGTFTAQTVGSPIKNVTVTHASSGAVTAFAADSAATLAASGSSGTATWNLTVPAGGYKTLKFVMAVADTSTTAVTTANTSMGNFTTVFNEAESKWSERWQNAFTPDNTDYSGWLPVLETDDTAIRSLYYMSALSVLACQRNNLGPNFNSALGRAANATFTGWDRVYVTAAPEYAVTLTYFWDTSYCSLLLALLDPDMLKKQAKYWLGQDIHAHYAIECVGGGTVGPWYSANDLTVSSTLLNYIKFNADKSFLADTVGTKSVLKLLTENATYWQGLVPSGQQLANYGADSNLFEVLPNYVQQVPCFNAANVWLMNEVAALKDSTSDTATPTATDLRTSANSLLPNVKALYIDGKGYWNSRKTDGTLTAVRTVVDFAITANLLAGEFTATQKQEMKDFVNTDLVTGDWMRALSLNDPMAPTSTRPDHGSTGAYDSWPALTAQTFARFGDYDGAVKLLQRFAGATSQGAFAQAHLLRSTYVPTVTVDDYADLNPTDKVSLTAWINPSSWPTNIWQGSIIAKDTWSGGNAGYVLRGGAGGALSFSIVVGGTWVELKTTATVSTGSWHHVAAVYDGSNMALYIDGAQKASQAQTGALTPSTGTPLIVGNCPSDASRNFLGSIDEARVYNKALTATEITTLSGATAADSGAGDSALVLRLPFDEGTGTTAQARGRHNATITAATWTTSGKFSNALTFGASGSRVSVTDQESLNPSAAVSLTAWIKPSSWPASIWQGSIIAKDTWSGGDAGYVLRGGAGGELSFALCIGGAWTELQTTATVSTGSWHHVAAVYDGSSMALYIDGVQKASKAQTGALTPSTGTPVEVGNCPQDHSRTFVGDIDEARVYNKALTATEITTLSGATAADSGVGDSALVLRLPFDEGSGTTAKAWMNEDATIDAATWTASGKFGSALSYSSGQNKSVVGWDLQTANEVCGGRFAEVIITDLFGYNPTVDSATDLRDSTTSRGFVGTLSGVRYGTKKYTIASDSSGVSITTA